MSFIQEIYVIQKYILYVYEIFLQLLLLVNTDDDMHDSRITVKNKLTRPRVTQLVVPLNPQFSPVLEQLF